MLGALLKWHIKQSLYCLEETSHQVHNVNCNVKEIDDFKITQLLCKWLTSTELHSPVPPQSHFLGLLQKHNVFGKLFKTRSKHCNII